MKKLVLIFAILIIYSQGAFTQGKYIPIPKENYATFYGDCNLDVRLPQNAPWYVFSDREDNPIFSTANGATVVKSANLGDAYLVIGNYGDRLQVVEADKVIYVMKDQTWKFRAGNSNSNVTQGWIPREKLLLNQKCLKVCNVGLPSAPTGMFNLQGLYVSNVATANPKDDKYFSKIPGSLKKGDVQNDADRFGYIYKVKRVGKIDWYLIGQTDVIKIGDNRIALRGWKPQNQIELWKHRMALEYNWEAANDRSTNGTRLKVLKDNHTASISRTDYAAAPLVDAEYSYKKGSPSTKYYFERDLGTGFRHVVLEENQYNYKVGVLKNTDSIDPQILNPAREIANAVVEKLLNPKVIFVLDGTQSLNKEIPNIIQTIKSTADTIKTRSGKLFNYMYSASIYRDKGYDQVFENRVGFSSNIADITNWLTTNLPHSSGIDCDQREAIFYGLNKTIDYFEGLPDTIKSYFNPTFYVLIGDAGSKDPDLDGVTAEIIKSKLKSNVSDLVAIQFSHDLTKLNCGTKDNGVSFDLFRTQFQNILSSYGKTEEKSITGGTKVTCNTRPGSFLAYPSRGSAFGSNDLGAVIKDALLNYNNTIQEKVIHLALMLRDGNTNTSKRELHVFVENIIEKSGFDIKNSEMDQIVEWVIRLLENYANSIITNNSTGNGTNVKITNSSLSFFNTGYVSLKYDFLGKQPPYKHVIYMNSDNLDKIIEFSGRIGSLRGGNVRNEIKGIWYHMLKTSLGIYQTDAQVDSLTISNATSLLTGFKSSSIYNDIQIVDISSGKKFPDKLLFRYVYEWAITNRYLQSVKNGKWQLTKENLTTLKPIINAIRTGKSPIADSQIADLSTKFVRKDNRTLVDYYKRYPQEFLDVKYKTKAYWIEADFFSTMENDFVKMLP